MKSKTAATVKSLHRRFVALPKHLIYPAVVLGLLAIGTITGVSGSSIGMYHLILGKGEDSSLILGEPRGIRGDEWQLITSKTIAQSFNNYEAFNPNIGVNGENVSLRPDVPTRDFNTLFRPQNWAFLVMPLENAIAYKWWFFTALVLVSAYYFTRRFFTKNIWVGIFLGIFLVFSALPQWTYREFIFLVLGFGLLGIMCADWLIVKHLSRKKTSSKSGSSRSAVLKVALASSALAYLAVCYTLVLYPPMQISIAIVLLAFFADLIVRRKREFGVSFRDVISAQRWVGIGIAVSLAIIGLLYIQQQSTVLALRNTEHPGVRHFESGWSGQTFGRLRNLLVGGSTPLILQKDTALKQSDYFAETVTGNQSEASNYPWILPFLVLALGYGYLKGKRKVHLPWFMISAVGLLLVWMLVPGISMPIIDQVHPNRWNLAVGLLTFLLLGWGYQMIKHIRKPNDGWTRYIFIAAGLVFLLLNITLFYTLRNDFPELIGKPDALIFVVMAVVTPILILAGRYTWSIGLLAIASFVINVNVNPLYQGVSAATDSNIVKAIKAQDEKAPGTWVMGMNVVSFEHLPLLAGAKSFNTHFSYPQKFWDKFDPTGKLDVAYNRTAHIQVDLTDEKSEVYLESTNKIGVHLNPCESIARELDIRYIVTYSTYMGEGESCMRLVTTAPGAGPTLFKIYEVNK